MNGSIIYGGHLLFQDKEYLLRGLSITDKYIIVCGSEFSKREDRTATDGAVHFLRTDGEHEKVATIKIIGCGSLKEIRHVGVDYALSIHQYK